MNDQHETGRLDGGMNGVSECGSRLSAKTVPGHGVADRARSHHTEGGPGALRRLERHGTDGSESTNRPMTPEFGELRSSTDRVDHALRRCRPLRRRLRMTFRPARSDIRARKPCFMALRRLFGWNVRFTAVSCHAVVGSASAGPVACRSDPGHTRIDSRRPHGRAGRVPQANAGRCSTTIDRAGASHQQSASLH